MIQKCFILGLAQIPEGFPKTDYFPEIPSSSIVSRGWLQKPPR